MLKPTYIITVCAIVLAASLSGCLETTITDVDYNKHGLQYVGTVTKEPFSAAQYNLTITGKLDGYPYSGTAIGPISGVVVTSEVISLMPNVTHFIGVSHIDLQDGERYELLTERVVTKLDFINDTEQMHYNGTLIQERGKEPYYDITIKTVESKAAQMFVVNASMIGYETNVSVIIDVDTLLGPGGIVGRKDLNAPEDEWLENTTTGIFAGEDGMDMPGFGAPLAIIGLALVLFRRRFH